MKRTLRFLGGALPLVVILTAALLARGDEPIDYAGTLIEPPSAASDFTLRSADGEVRLSDYRGRYVILFFGYTSCPDVCPMTLARLSSAMRSIGPEAEENVQVVMITVDPERDTPERLAEYTSSFGPNVIGLTGSLAELESVADSYGMHFAKIDGSDETGYLVDHSATTTVVDRDGQVRLLWSPMHELADIESDLRALLRS